VVEYTRQAVAKNLLLWNHLNRRVVPFLSTHRFASRVSLREMQQMLRLMHVKDGVLAWTLHEYSTPAQHLVRNGGLKLNARRYRLWRSANSDYSFGRLEQWQAARSRLPSVARTVPWLFCLALNVYFVFLAFSQTTKTVVFWKRPVCFDLNRWFVCFLRLRRVPDFHRLPRNNVSRMRPHGGYFEMLCWAKIQ